MPQDSQRRIEVDQMDDTKLSIELQGLEPVPVADRKGPVWRIFTVWFSANMVPPTFFIGTLAAADYIQLGFFSGLMAILLGNLIGASFVGLMATMGPSTGMPQLTLGRFSFGRANVLPAFLNWVGMVAWAAINTVFGATAFSLLTGLPYWVGALAVISLMAVIVVVGYDAILLFQRYIAIVLAIVFAVVAFKIGSVGDFSRADGFEGADRAGAFVLMTTIVASFSLSWCVFGSDYTRYLPPKTSSWKVFGFASGGLFVACAWLQVLGLAVAGLVTGSGVGTIRDEVLGGGVLGGIAMVAVFLGIVSVTVLNTYTGALSLMTVGISIPRPVSALLVAALAFGTTLWLNSTDLAGSFTNFMLLLSYWVSPFAAVVLTDWWIRGRKADTEQILRLDNIRSGWEAVIAFAVGIVASIPFMSSTLYTGPIASEVLHYGDIAYYVGFVASALCYYVITAAQKRKVSASAP